MEYDDEIDKKNQKEEKRQAIRRILKDKLGLSSVTDISVMRRRYNGGMFGCTIMGSSASSTNARNQYNDSYFGGAIEDSSNNP